MARGSLPSPLLDAVFPNGMGSRTRMPRAQRSSCAVALGRLTCSGRRAPRRSFVSASVPPAPEAIRQAAEGVP